MSYDLEVSSALRSSKASTVIGEGRAKQKKTSPTRIEDLEAIVLLLELAAITLSDKPSAAFTMETLYNEACSIAGDEATLDIEDVQIVVEKAKFLKKAKKNAFSLR